jgi:protein-tyrosine phosphatase
MGNICRSPTAEGVLRALVAERGLDGAVEVDSAGTHAYHTGEPPDRRMRRTALDRGYELRGRARQVTPEDLHRFDLVIAMDRTNLADLQTLEGGGTADLRLFSDFLPPGSPPDVPDPYYGGHQGFEKVLDLVEQGCPAILDGLLER